MGLFHSHSDQPRQPDNKELLLLNQLRQASAPYEPMVTAALQWLANWAMPECQVERVESAASGYQWQLWHTRENGSKFVDVTVAVFFPDRHPDKPDGFVVDFKTPGGYERSATGPLIREDLFYTVRRVVSAH